MLNRLSVTGLFILVSSIICSAQKNFEDGYVVTLNNDTIYGSIDIKSNAQNSKSCLFLPKGEQSLQSYTPAEIKSFRTATKYYLAREVELNSQKQLLFIEYLVDGIVDLYYLKDVLNEYYFVEKDGNMVPLSNNQTSVTVTDNTIDQHQKTYVKNSNQYIGVLNFLFRDAGGMSERIAHTRFHYSSLINLTKDYHNAVCKDYECIDFTKSSKQKMYLQIGAGIMQNTMGLKTSSQTVSDINPSVSAELRFTPLKSNTNWNVILGIGYSQVSSSGYFKNDLYQYEYKDTFLLSASYSIVRIPLHVEYLFGKGKFQPAIFAGYNASILFNTDYFSFAHLDEKNYIENSPFRKFHHGVSAGVMAKYNFKKTSYIYLRSEFEYRIPSANLKFVFDYLRNKAIIVQFGYGFSI